MNRQHQFGEREREREGGSDSSAIIFTILSFTL